MESITITKLGAARQQLETAILLFFDRRDPVAIHTLVGAAYDIIDDVNQRRGGTEMFVKHRYVQLPGRPEIGAINSPQNFFKHADRDPDAELEFFPEMTESFLVDACRKYMDLTGEFVALFHCIMWWFNCRLGADGFDFPAEKRELLDDLLALFAAGDRQEFMRRCARD
jgi:hypothetical protein